MAGSLRIDFNADLGEGADDRAILPFITSASLACGGHAGDAASMRAAIGLCLAQGVAIGAHPSLEDREGFGRRELPTTPEQVHALVRRQTEALADIADAMGAKLRHVKPHGALYNMAARDPALAEAIAAAVRGIDPGLRLVGLSGSALTAAAGRQGLALAHEVFAERRYEADGRLTPRGQVDACIDDIDAAVAQALSLACDGSVLARTGERLPLRADTLCLHGDRRDAAAFARALRAALDGAGVTVQAMDPP